MITLYYYLVIGLPILLEGFPVSSSGHVELLLHFLHAQDYVSLMYQLPTTIDHILHGPIACMILIFFYKEWTYLLYYIRHYFFAFVRIACFIALTTGVTAGGYFLLNGTSTLVFPLYYGYAITTLCLFSLLFCQRTSDTNFLPVPSQLALPAYRNFDEMGSLVHGARNIHWYADVVFLLKALLLGCVQAVSLLPGISRFGSTFVAARWLGFSGLHAFQVSFLMELPISCAGFLKGILFQDAATYHDLLQIKFLLTILSASCLGLGGFFIVSKIIRADRLWMFGIYTLLLTWVSWILR